ncbi:MAG: GyrI-like domain-containing protein [Armatimonadota bacterium]
MSDILIKAKKDPQIGEAPTVTMAVVRSKGDPNVVMEGIMPALYGAVYTLKFALKKQGIDFKVEPLRARWPDAHLLPEDQWTAYWGIPLPEGTTEVPRKVPDVEVTVEQWAYGTVATILHLGPYSEEGPTIQRLHEFIAAQGYEIAGVHEEIYLTSPKAKVQKTVIVCPVRKRG